MNNSITKKVFLLTGIIIICSLLGYALYSNYKKTQDTKVPTTENPSQVNQDSSKDIFIKTKEECDRSAKELFSNLKTIDDTDKASSYVYQFNSEKCYVLVSFSKIDKSFYLRKELNLLYFPGETNGAIIGHYSKDQDGKITLCQVREYETANWAYCQNEEEFNQLMKDSGYLK